MGTLLRLLLSLWTSFVRFLGTKRPLPPPSPSYHPTAQERDIQDDVPTIPKVPTMPPIEDTPPGPAAPVPQYTSDLSDEFFRRLVRMSRKQGWDVGMLFPVMMYESGMIPSKANPAGAYGLIQFYGKKFAYVVDLSAEEQAPLIENYYRAAAPYRSVGEVYGQTFLPERMRLLGRTPDTVLTSKGEAFYDKNSTLDYNHDGDITIADLESVAMGATLGRGANRYNEALARYRYHEATLPDDSGPGSSGGILAAGAAAAVLFLYLLRRG